MQRGRPPTHHRPAALFEEHDRRIRVQRQGARGRSRQQCGVPVDDQALTCQLRRRQHQVAPWPAAKCTVCRPHAGHHAGHGDRGGPLHVAITHDGRPRKQARHFAVARKRIVGGVQSARRAHSIVHDMGATSISSPQHHAAAGRRTAHPGLDDANRERCGHRRIHRVATRLKDRSADFGGAAMLGRNHASARGHDLLADNLRIREVVHRGRLCRALNRVHHAPNQAHIPCTLIVSLLIGQVAESFLTVWNACLSPSDPAPTRFQGIPGRRRRAAAVT